MELLPKSQSNKNYCKCINYKNPLSSLYKPDGIQYTCRDPSNFHKNNSLFVASSPDRRWIRSIRFDSMAMCRRWAPEQKHHFEPFWGGQLKGQFYLWCLLGLPPWLWGEISTYQGFLLELFEIIPNVMNRWCIKVKIQALYLWKPTSDLSTTWNLAPKCPTRPTLPLFL